MKAVKMTPQLNELLEEYGDVKGKRLSLIKAHPTPTGGEDYDYLYLRDDMDFRWYQQRIREIESDVGNIVLEQWVNGSRDRDQ